MGMPKIPRISCLACGKETTRARKKYCDNTCQHEYEYQVYIQKWQNGKVSGLNCLGLVSNPIKRFLRRKFQDKCCLCGWSRVNVSTGKVPLVADHIDGNWRNNSEKNLRLVCPNCDALNPTFAALNKGNGRENRVPSKRAQEGRRLLNKDMPV